MPIKNNHNINVHVKNVIKLDHNKKKTRRRRKNKNNKNIMPLARPNNSVYNPNATTYFSGGGGGGGGIILAPTNKSGYDMKPRIGFGIDPNDTTSTNMTQQLLSEHQKQNDDKTNQMFLEHQKQNDDKTNQMFINYHKNFVNGMKLYHNNYVEPLKNDIHILQSDFDSYKMSNYPLLYPDSPLKETLTNDLLTADDNYNKDNNNNVVYNDENSVLYDPLLKPYYPDFNIEDIYNSKNADNFDDKDGYPILHSNNADNFSPPPFDEFISNNFNNANLNEDFDVQSVDDENDEVPKDNSVLEVVMIPQYLSKINNADNLRYIIKNHGLNINTQNLNVKSLKDKIKQKILELNPGIDTSSIIFNLPADILSDNQLAEGKKLLKQKKSTQQYKKL